MKWHPDRNQAGTEEERLKAEKMFKDINEANDVLSDPNKKRQFDMGMYDPTGGAGASTLAEWVAWAEWEASTPASYCKCSWEAAEADPLAEATVLVMILSRLSEVEAAEVAAAEEEELLTDFREASPLCQVAPQEEAEDVEAIRSAAQEATHSQGSSDRI